MENSGFKIVTPDDPGFKENPFMSFLDKRTAIINHEGCKLMKTVTDYIERHDSDFSKGKIAVSGEMMFTAIRCIYLLKHAMQMELEQKEPDKATQSERKAQLEKFKQVLDQYDKKGIVSGVEYPLAIDFFTKAYALVLKGVSGHYRDKSNVLSERYIEDLRCLCVTFNKAPVEPKELSLLF